MPGIACIYIAGTLIEFIYEYFSANFVGRILLVAVRAWVQCFPTSFIPLSGIPMRISGIWS